MSVAMGYDDRDLAMVSEGWWKLAPAECFEFKAPDRAEHQYYYLYARGDRGGNWSSDDPADESAFCYRTGNFKLINRDMEKGGKLECMRRRANQIKFRRIDTFIAGKPVPKYVYRLVRTGN